ncbi:Kua-ubiquitin conjugating enzyme hybrid [Macleaya cordata]|uniref:Kua-ubiquitin conjugating enzyme hybrid n=1 Tax=Macleaya cordata TaxID=56857 RepID=A0A200QBI7_MACCD|nr:Kua-ubiquitin conjugating enzyme hybrid [Macleaya cordata]
MSISPQHRSLFRQYPYYTHTSRPHLVTRLYCSTTTTTSPRSSQVAPIDHLSPLPSPVPLVPPRTTQNKPILDDPNLQSTWSHRAWVASGSISVLISLLKSAISVATDTNISLEPVLAGLLGYVLADLGSGVYHWAIDNYGDVLPIDLVSNEPAMNAFVGMFSGCIMFSQQFHAWAHGTKSKLPPLVLALQDAGVLVSRAEHGAHHRPPYNNNYCIVSGAWNRILDENRVFEALEMVVFLKFGVRPRSWSEPNSDWTEQTLMTDHQSNI